MNTIALSPVDLAVSASLVVLDAILSMILALRLHRQIAVAAVRMVVQLAAIGYVLKLVFALNSPAATLAIVLVMILVAAREVAARPERRFKDFSNLALVRALVLDPTVLLLDEPTGALDQDSTHKVEGLIRELLDKGVAVVLVTHDDALGDRLATARYRMADRRLGAA